MDIHEAYSKSPLFNNEKINRRLNKEDIILFMDDLVEQGIYYMIHYLLLMTLWIKVMLYGLKRINRELK